MTILKRKHSESSEIGKSPKHKPLQDELVLPEDTPEWRKLLFDRIKNIEVNLDTSLDYVVDVAAEALIQVGSLKNLCREQSVKMDDVTPVCPPQIRLQSPARKSHRYGKSFKEI